MSKTTMAIITNGSQQRYFVEESEIRSATFGDYLEAGYSYDDMGLNIVGENEDGKDLFEGGYNFEGRLTWEEIEDLEVDGYCISYWDGNNWQIDIFENYYTEEVEIENLDPPSPEYYFNYKLILEDGEKVICTKSNMSGSLSPYYKEDIED